MTYTHTDNDVTVGRYTFFVRREFLYIAAAGIQSRHATATDATRLDGISLVRLGIAGLARRGSARVIPLHFSMNVAEATKRDVAGSRGAGCVRVKDD